MIISECSVDALISITRKRRALLHAKNALLYKITKHYEWALFSAAATCALSNPAKFI